MGVILFAYFGPETMLPLTSIVATVIGIFMMFGRNTFRLVRRGLLGRFSGGRAGTIPTPHFHADAERRSPSDVTRS